MGSVLNSVTYSKNDHSGDSEILRYLSKKAFSASVSWWCIYTLNHVYSIWYIKVTICSTLPRNDNNAEGRGYGKKQTAARNKLHRGIALIRKDADFPLVSHCRNRNKLRNMRKSITPNGEILIDTKCYWAVSWNYKGRNENCRPISKGYGMLERYAVKVACTVLRRGRAGNRSSLVDFQFVANDPALTGACLVYRQKKLRSTT
jgi:hypothetical protein